MQRGSRRAAVRPRDDPSELLRALHRRPREPLARHGLRVRQRAHPAHRPGHPHPSDPARGLRANLLSRAETKRRAETSSRLGIGQQEWSSKGDERRAAAGRAGAADMTALVRADDAPQTVAASPLTFAAPASPAAARRSPDPPNAARSPPLRLETKSRGG